jgi:hypothetical protein
MLADTPDVDAPTRAVQCLPDDLPVRRMGFEHEFFLVDQRGELSDLADPFLWRCQEAAIAKGLDPHCFKPECVTNLVEVTTPPSSGFADMARGYLSNLDLALEVASEHGLSLYPLGTYPLPVWPVVRDDPGHRIKERTIGHDRFLQAGRCAGAHLETPPGNELDPEVGRVIYIGDSPAVFAEGAHPERGDDEQATMRAANKEPV